MPLPVGRILWAPKESEPELYQDAACGDPASRRFAISDGVSSCLHSGGWAEELVTLFCTSPPEGMATQHLEPWCAPRMAPYHRVLVDWATRIADEDPRRFSFPALAQHGSSATLLAVRFGPSADDGSVPWEALGVGDCCLFLWRQGILTGSWPKQSSAEFDSRPAQISTLGIHGDAWVQSGCMSGGDTMVLATDAVSAWICDHPEEALADLTQLSQDQWEGWLNERRATRAMHDDDATVLVIQIGEAGDMGADRHQTPHYTLLPGLDATPPVGGPEPAEDDGDAPVPGDEPSAAADEEMEIAPGVGPVLDAAVGERLNTVEGRLEQADLEISELRQAITDIRDSNRQTDADMVSLRSDHQDLQRHYSALAKKHVELQSSCEDLRRDHEWLRRRLKWYLWLCESGRFAH